MSRLTYCADGETDARWSRLSHQRSKSSASGDARLAKLIGFDLIDVPGATGFIDTNYEGKGQAAVEALKKYDLVFVHIEAPDEAGHEGDTEAKKKAIEQVDKYIAGPILKALEQYESWRILVLPDHPTPVHGGAHSAEPVPFAMAGPLLSRLGYSPLDEA